MLGPLKDLADGHGRDEAHHRRHLVRRLRRGGRVQHAGHAPRLQVGPFRKNARKRHQSCKGEKIRENVFHRQTNSSKQRRVCRCWKLDGWVSVPIVVIFILSCSYFDFVSWPLGEEKNSAFKFKTGQTEASTQLARNKNQAITLKPGPIPYLHTNPHLQQHLIVSAHTHTTNFLSKYTSNTSPLSNNKKLHTHTHTHLFPVLQRSIYSEIQIARNTLPSPCVPATRALWPYPFNRLWSLISGWSPSNWHIL